MKKNGLSLKFGLVSLFFFFISIQSFAQKSKDIEPVLYCVKDLSNGLYQATFSYYNPTNKEVIIDESGSIIKSNKGKKISKGLNKFKPGSVDKVFTKEFGPQDYVEWTIISNGNTHTVYANANSAKCSANDGFIFPVIGNGKSYDLIGQELSAFCDNVIGDTPSDLIFQLKDEKVLVEIVPIDTKLGAVITLLKSTVFGNGSGVPDEDFLLFKTNLNTDLDGLGAIDVYMDTDDLCLLNNYPLLINFARPVYPSIKHAFGAGSTGLSVSQGDATQTSDVVRESFKLIDADGHVLPVDGTGITIGVMSNSYNTQSVSDGNLSRAAVDVKQGDLPGTGVLTSDNNPNGNLTNVEVLNEYPEELSPADSDEGRAMMHIIHDVAPGAKLAFYAASLSPRKFEEGFKALAGLNTKGVKSDLIVDDITFITEPFFGEGRISEAINTFTTAGGIHFTSAGNFADHGYKSTFAASSNVPTTNFIDRGSETRAHLFDGPEGSDYLQKISVVPGTYMIALQWKELAASQDNNDGAFDDLDIYIVDDFGRLLVGSNRVNIKGDPTEVIVFRATGSGDANILITRVNGTSTTTVPFRYIAFQSDGLTWEYHTLGTPTISGHAMTEQSVTVGAIRFNKEEPESFSSFGGTLPDGSSALVDFAAPDGVNTNVISIGTRFYADGTPIDEDEYPNFFGTSASAPSAAAAVALLQSALPTWYPDLSNPGKSTKTVEEVINLFKANAKGGVSETQAGAGMIDANKVFNSLAAQTSRITSFEFVPKTDIDSASIATVTIKIIGEFLPVPVQVPNSDPAVYTESVVYLDGVAIAYTVGEDGEILAEIPPFSGNPNLQIYTAPKEGSEGNGGFSEPYPFFQDGKNIITVTADPLKIRFGEEYKSKLTYTIEGIELLDGETYPEAITRLGFPDISLSAGFDDSVYLDVKNYTVTPSFDEGNFRDTDGDGVFDVYDQCPLTSSGADVDGNGCSDAQKGAENFTPVTTYKVNFKGSNLAIEKNNLVIKPKNAETYYGQKIAVELEYSGYGTTDDEGNYSLNSINNPEAFLAKIKEAHINDFYVDPTTKITPIGLINNFKLGTALDADGNDRYHDILGLLENGSWIASENTFLNRLEEGPYRGGSYPEDAGYAERVYGSVNTDLGSGFINFNPHDFTAYLDYFNPEGSSVLDGQSIGIINGQALGIINGQALGIINGQAIGIINGQALGIINGQAIGIINGQAIGIVNGQAFGIVNGQAFGIINGQAFGIINNDSGLSSGSDTNDYNKVFSIIDMSDYSAECLTEGNCTIPKYYALNLITGDEVTNSVPHYIFPGTFINSMSDNFNITYEKAELTVAKKNLTVSIPNFTIEYGDALTKDRLLEETTVFDGWAYSEDIATYFADDEQPFEFVKEGKIYQIGELKDLGDYTIVLKALDNYTFSPSNNLGTVTINKATLEVTISPEKLIVNQGDTPVLSTTFDSGNAYEEGVNDVFPTGIPYYFVDGNGDEYYDTNLPGAYYIKISDPENYSIVSNEALLFVNPSDSNAKKVRVYADCVSYDPNAIGDLKYTVVYRYENDNDYPVYVNEGEDNKLTGTNYSGQLPTIFMPGDGTFEFKFDGNQLVWSLTTYDGTNKSSVSSVSTSESGKCDAKLDGAYSIYPNPVTTFLYIKQNVVETNVSVLVLNMYGFVVINAGTFTAPFSTMIIPMSDLSTGIYIVRITSSTDVRTYNVLKE